MPRREFSDQYRDRDEVEFDLRERKFDLIERGRQSHLKGKRFEDEVATLYELLGWKVKIEIDLFHQNSRPTALVTRSFASFTLSCGQRSPIASRWEPNWQALNYLMLRLNVRTWLKPI
jgi:hypothetical protein